MHDFTKKSKEYKKIFTFFNPIPVGSILLCMAWPCRQESCLNLGMKYAPYPATYIPAGVYPAAGKERGVMLDS
jgi:hypothetical protein